MKRGHVGVLLAMLLAGPTVYGQTLARGTGSDGAGGEHVVLPSHVHSQMDQRPGVSVLKGGIDPRSVYYRGNDAGLHPGWRAGDVRYDGDRYGHHDRSFDHGRGQQTVVFVNVAAYYNAGAYADAPTVDQVQDAYYQPGYQWGVSLGQYRVTWDQLLNYLSAYVVTAPPVAQDAFRAGFIDGFGDSGPATFDHAMQIAGQ